MKQICKKIPAVLFAVAMSLSLLTACGEEKAPAKAPATDEVSGEWNGDDWNEFGEQHLPGTGREVTSVGRFTTQDIGKNAVTQEIFGEHRLTMVNVFATWCSPCVAEMPDLEKLHQQMKEKDVGVVGVVLDVLDEKGEIMEDALEDVQLLVKKTGVTYPVLLPDSGYFGGRLIGIEAIPETFFVDEKGNIVGESYSGSGSLEDWVEVVQNELAGLKEGK